MPKILVTHSYIAIPSFGSSKRQALEELEKKKYDVLRVGIDPEDGGFFFVVSKKGAKNNHSSLLGKNFCGIVPLGRHVIKK